MTQLSSQERISRIEQAPIEMQAMVAKAFLRDDIDDEDIQYLFNTDSLEEMDDEDTQLENVNAEEPNGIGAIEFTMRTTKPSNNKNYITTGSGGWNTCIKGYPMDANANVLANCVGYASGRFNEIINNARGTEGCAYKTLNCNAINFKERAEKAGLKTGNTPKVGAIMCWGNSSAGHVEVVERVDNNNQVYTSGSSYGGTAFFNKTRTNSNGRWGLNSGYYFRCFIYQPEDVQKWIDGTPLPEITPTVSRDIYKDQLETLQVMNVRVGIETTSQSLGTVPAGNIYNYYDMQQGKSSKWYAITSDKSQWIAGVNNNGTKYCAIYPAQPKPQPTPTLKVGDKVKIVGTGNGSSYGTANTAYGIGWTRQILRILDGRPYPYQVGNNTGTTGYYKAEALQKI